MKERKTKVMEAYKGLSKRAKAGILGVNLSSCYVKPKSPSQDTVTMMNEIREIYSKRPFQGYRRIAWDLKDKGYKVSRNRVYRLMKEMGLQAIYPKKNLSKRNQAHKVYPYLLKEHPPEKPHDVYCVDITYLKIATGFVYLTALIDVVSRYVCGYHVSTTLETESCVNALEMAVKQGFIPKILNSDQGAQFTAQEWLYSLSLLGIRVSMDGKGRALDNIPIERLWRTIKYEEVYLKTYETVKEAKEGIKGYIDWYNTQRRHSGLKYHRPYEVLMGLKNADNWPFARGDGYVDNAGALPHIPTPPTTTEIKSKQLMENITPSLSSKIAA